MLTAHKGILVGGDLERRVGELEQALSRRGATASIPPPTSELRSGASTPNTRNNGSLANRLARLEHLLGSAPLPISLKVIARAWVDAFDMEELAKFETRWEAAGTSGHNSLLNIFPEGTAERQEVSRRLEPALERTALEMTGKSCAELLREEADEQR
jgi:hypothetical protein